MYYNSICSSHVYYVVQTSSFLLPSLEIIPPADTSRFIVKPCVMTTIDHDSFSQMHLCFFVEAGKCDPCGYHRTCLKFRHLVFLHVSHCRIFPSRNSFEQYDKKPFIVVRYYDP